MVLVVVSLLCFFFLMNYFRTLSQMDYNLAAERLCVASESEPQGLFAHVHIAVGTTIGFFVGTLLSIDLAKRTKYIRTHACT